MQTTIVSITQKALQKFRKRIFQACYTLKELVDDACLHEGFVLLSLQNTDCEHCLTEQFEYICSWWQKGYTVHINWITEEKQKNCNFHLRGCKANKEQLITQNKLQ